jgi:phosphoglycolate phosphatase
LPQPEKMQRGEMIIWDWNGTLLNDIDICIESINCLLDRRGMKSITKDFYLDFFRFPVIDFYVDLGFNFESEDFDALSDEYINQYLSIEARSSLHDGAIDLLNHFQANHVDQIVLSAMEQHTLTRAVGKYNIRSYFTDIIGTPNFYGQGKLETARQFIEKSSLSPSQITLLGDTVHDFEVAKALGCNCILISGGHQPYEKLVKTGLRVEKNLTALLDLITS